MVLKKYFGTKDFYKAVFRIMLPILLQNVITMFVSLLDNIMVGQVGTEQMSGVAIANQILFIFNLCIFGGISGVGIFSAQYYGKQDHDGIRYTVRAKLFVAVTATILFAVAFLTAGGMLVSSFLHEGNEGLDLVLTYQRGMSYLHLMMLQMLPFAVSQVFASTLRECNEAMFPMKASIAATLINLVGNYILIFGHFGAPKLGVEGAAIATVIARFAELIILLIYSIRHTDRFPFLKGLLRSLRIPKDLVKNMAKKGTPLLLNEVLWAAGMALLNQCYSVRGLEVVSATNISSTISNLFHASAMAMGSTIAIMIGQHLGGGRLKQAEEDDKKLIMLTILMNIVLGVILAALARPLANIYNTSDSVHALAASFMRVIALYLPFMAYTNACYFTLRSGGKTIITFLFDSFFIWVVYVPVAFCLVHFTNVQVIPVFFIVNAIEVLKCVVGFFMLRSRKWIVNLVGTKETS
jgi:putative MATE family efflux protein